MIIVICVSSWVSDLGHVPTGFVGIAWLYLACVGYIVSRGVGRVYVGTDGVKVPKLTYSSQEGVLSK